MSFEDDRNRETRDDEQALEEIRREFAHNREIAHHGQVAEHDEPPEPLPERPDQAPDPPSER